MSIYQDIYDAQRSQGNMGGHKGSTYGKYKNGKAQKTKERKEPKVSEKVTFKITIHSGEVYKSTDSNGLSDPYVKVCKGGLLGKALMETEVVHKNLKPSWEHTEEVTFSTEKGKNPSLNFELLDKDMIGSDKIGSTSVSLSSSGANHEQVSFNVEKGGKNFINGKIIISYSKV